MSCCLLIEMPDEVSDVVDVYTEEFFDVCSDVSSEAASVILEKHKSVVLEGQLTLYALRASPQIHRDTTPATRASTADCNTRVHGGVQ